MNLPIIYAWHTDIVFHLLSHMKVENASNIFNEAYVEEIKAEKRNLGMIGDLAEEMESVTDYYMNHFERLTVINFLPFITKSFEELIQTLMTWDPFTEEDHKAFINTFITLLEKEKAFYHTYWHQKDHRLRDQKDCVKKHLKDRLSVFKCLFAYYEHYKQIEVEILLSYSMGQNGRGCCHQNTQLVALPFPLDEDDEENTFFMALHELTHPCTDELVGQVIAMEDGSHALTENIVMLADYEMIKAVEPLLVENYFRWICNKSGNPTVQLDEEMFYNVFRIPDQIKEALKARIEEIVASSSESIVEN